MREVWRHARLKQPLGSRDGYRTRQLGGNGLKSTTGGSRGAAPLRLGFLLSCHPKSPTTARWSVGRSCLDALRVVRGWSVGRGTAHK